MTSGSVSGQAPGSSTKVGVQLNSTLKLKNYRAAVRISLGEAHLIATERHLPPDTDEP